LLFGVSSLLTPVQHSFADHFKHECGTSTQSPHQLLISSVLKPSLKGILLPRLLYYIIGFHGSVHGVVRV
jgi:hypothetical protein